MSWKSMEKCVFGLSLVPSLLPRFFSTKTASAVLHTHWYCAPLLFYFCILFYCCCCWLVGYEVKVPSKCSFVRGTLSVHIIVHFSIFPSFFMRHAQTHMWIIRTYEHSFRACKTHCTVCIHTALYIRESRHDIRYIYIFLGHFCLFCLFEYPCVAEEEQRTAT